MRIDHVIYAADDVEAVSAKIARELGVPAAGGGRHEGHGTYNRIVPLGGGYVEVLGLADADEAERSDFGRGLLQRLSEAGEGWLAWVVAVPDIAPVARRLGTTITTLRREGLSARLTGVAEAMSDPSLPFFVSRDPGVRDPGADGDADGIAWIEVAADAGRLARWTDNAPLSVRIVSGPHGIRAIGVGDRAWP